MFSHFVRPLEVGSRGLNTLPITNSTLRHFPFTCAGKEARFGEEYQITPLSFVPSSTPLRACHRYAPTSLSGAQLSCKASRARKTTPRGKRTLASNSPTITESDEPSMKGTQYMFQDLEHPRQCLLGLSARALGLLNVPILCVRAGITPSSPVIKLRGKNMVIA